jgi:hypothetical protein
MIDSDKKNCSTIFMVADNFIDPNITIADKYLFI